MLINNLQILAIKGFQSSYSVYIPKTNFSIFSFAKMMLKYLLINYLIYRIKNYLCSLF